MDVVELLNKMLPGDWQEVNKNRIERYEMMIKVTKHSVKRKKIMDRLKWLKSLEVSKDVPK